MTTFPNPYATPPNFDELAAAVPTFAPFVRTASKGHPTIDFQDPVAIRALTAALLERDFRLSLDLPTDRLCPIVPGRLEYILWVLQLALDTREEAERSSAVAGLDIGTGASCIYPLLGCRSLPSLTFVATDVDAHSLSYARRNVATNQLDDRIDVRRVDELDGLFPSGSFDFTMCNPPFYDSAEEVEAGLHAKELEPFAVCTGGVKEMITNGGEVAFVGRMVEESLTARARIRWFSSLLGKYSSVSQIIALLKKHSIENYTIKELSQGPTKRYVVAWSLLAARLNSAKYHPTAADYSNPALAKLLPPSNAHTYYCPPSQQQIGDVRATLEGTLTPLDGLQLLWDTKESHRGLIKATHNGWSRSARRGKGVLPATAAMVATTNGGSFTDCGSTLLLSATLKLSAEGQQIKVEAEWTTGLDRARKDWTTLWAFTVRRLAESSGKR